MTGTAYIDKFKNILKMNLLDFFLEFFFRFFAFAFNQKHGYG